jgi:hypothetical protein
MGNLGGMISAMIVFVLGVMAMIIVLFWGNIDRPQFLIIIQLRS